MQEKMSNDPSASPPSRDLSTGTHSSSPHGHYVQANGLTIYYEEQGNGSPLLLLHGGIVTHESWRLLLPAWSRQYRVITPDSRGHGRTDNPTGAFSYELLADDMLAVIETLRLRNPIICAFSDGAYVALVMGTQVPDLAAAYIFLGGSYCLSTTVESRLTLQHALGIEGPERTALDDADLARMEQNRPDRVAYLREQHRHVYGPDYWKTYLKNVWPTWMKSLEYSAADLRRITVPSLVVLGDRDPYVPLDEAVELYRRLPTAEFAAIPAMDHAGFMRDRADVLAQVIADFLRRQVGTPATI